MKSPRDGETRHEASVSHLICRKEWNKFTLLPVRRGAEVGEPSSCHLELVYQQRGFVLTGRRRKVQMTPLELQDQGVQIYRQEEVCGPAQDQSKGRSLCPGVKFYMT